MIEDICLLDQLTGGRVDYGVGRGIAAIEHFWFQGDWYASRERFDEAIALVLRGLPDRRHRAGRAGSTTTSQDEPPPCVRCNAEPAHVVRREPHRRRPVRVRSGLARRHPQDAYDLYLATWDEYKDDPVRADAPGAVPHVGSTMLLGIGDDEAEGKAIAAPASAA